MNNNYNDRYQGREDVVKDNAKKGLFDLLTMDCFIIEILVVLYFIFYQSFKWTKYLGRELQNSEIFNLLRDAAFPIFIFAGFVSLMSIIKLIKNHKSEMKESMKFYIISLSFNAIFTILFFSAYFICRNAL